MSEVLQPLFGIGPALTLWQMTARAAVVFVLALALIRVSGRRSFGQHSPFDACITVLLGAVLSRAVVGASPFVATIAAGAVLVLIHRSVALASTRWCRFDDFINGREIELIRNGRVIPSAMRKALVTENNLHAAIRQTLGDVGVQGVDRAILERDGKVTIIGQSEHR